jgi:hypothetical protein
MGTNDVDKRDLHVLALEPQSLRAISVLSIDRLVFQPNKINFRSFFETTGG